MHTDDDADDDDVGGPSLSSVHFCIYFFDYTVRIVEQSGDEPTEMSISSGIVASTFLCFGKCRVCTRQSAAAAAVKLRKVQMALRDTIVIYQTAHHWRKKMAGRSVVVTS